MWWSGMEELDAARRDVKKTTESLSDATAKVQLKTALHQSKYVLLKSENDLTQEQQLKLEAIQQVSPLLARMHSFERRAEIFESSTKSDGTVFRLASICKTDFRKKYYMITRWFGEIVGYFEQGTTNGAVEELIINWSFNKTLRLWFQTR